MASILLIDDDMSVRASVSAALSGAGHDVALASNGLEGFRLYRSDPTDIVVTDLDMPEQDGLDTIAAIRREFPAAKIIAISERSGGFALSLAHVLGACQTFEKPVSNRRLLRCIEVIMAGV